MEEKAQAMLIGALIVLVVALVLALFLFYDFYMQEAQEFGIADEILIEDDGPIVDETISEDYPQGMLFYNNMRFAERDITYSIDDDCPEDRQVDARAGFDILSEETVLDFKEGSFGSDIIASCSQEEPEIESDFFVLGEGGPTHIINASKYNVITNGTIFLYKEDQCENPVVAIHEVLHVLGFQHSSNKKSIMYNFSSCNQKLTNNIIDKINELYKDDSLPDLIFSDVNAVKRGKYIDTHFTVRNVGLVNAGIVNVTIYDSSSKKEIIDYEIEEIGVGEGKIIKFQNLRGSRSLEGLSFSIDLKNQIQEIDEGNNFIELRLVD